MKIRLSLARRKTTDSCNLTSFLSKHTRTGKKGVTINKPVLQMAVEGSNFFKASCALETQQIFSFRIVLSRYQRHL